MTWWSIPWRLCLCLFVAAFTSIACAAETNAEPDKDATRSVLRDTQANLSLRGSYWTHSRRLDGERDVASVAAWGSVRTRLNDVAKFIFDGWLRNDHAFEHSSGKSEVRDAYLAASVGDWDLSAGRQLIVWGKADALNPTDVISVRNFTLLTPLDEDQKTGVGNVRATYNAGALRLSALWLPEYRSNTLPLPQTPGVTFERREPSRGYQQGALRIERSSEGLDWSVSYFDGFDKSPDLRLDGFGGNGTVVGLHYDRIRVLGADLATTLGRWGARAEFAYTWTTDASGSSPFVKNPFFYAVAGADRKFFDNLNVNAQALYRRIAHFEDPFAVAVPLQALAVRQALLSNQRDPEQVGASLRVSNKWRNDTLEAEVSVVLWLTHGDSLVRPRLKYAWTDHFKTTIGADFYRGPADSSFGNLRDLSTAFVEMQYDL